MLDGWIEEILIAAHATQLPLPVKRARAIAGIGVQGDRYSAGVGTWSEHPAAGGKDLTLIEAEVLTSIGFPGAHARRNLVTYGVRLNTLVGRRFRIGEVLCYGDRLCEPCAHLEQLSGIAIAALRNRGGLRADILTDGEIRIGDPVIAEPRELAIHAG